jgi:hypothetical protein
MNIQSRTRALTFAGALLAAVAAHPVEASAADGAPSWLRVELSGSDACSGAADLGARIEERLGRSPEQAARSLRIAMVARLERRRESEGWAGEIDVVGTDGATTGRRTLEQSGRSCEALVDRLSFVAALILDSGTIAAPAEARSDSAPQASVAAIAAPQQVGTKPTRSRWTLRVEGGAALAEGLLPGAAPGGEASVFAGPPGPVVAYVQAGFWPEARASVGPNQGAGLSLAEAGVGICSPRLRTARLRFEPCLGADLGRVRVRGFGLDNQVTSERWAADVAVGFALRWPAGAGPYASLGVRLVVPLVRDQITYLDPAGQDRALFRMSSVAVVGVLRLGCARE